MISRWSRDGYERSVRNENRPSFGTDTRWVGLDDRTEPPDDSSA